MKKSNLVSSRHGEEHAVPDMAFAGVFTKIALDKYQRKAALIEKATDMSSQEKQDALDRNYYRCIAEVYMGVISMAALVALLKKWGILPAGPKTIQSLAA